MDGRNPSRFSETSSLPNGSEGFEFMVSAPEVLLRKNPDTGKTEEPFEDGAFEKHSVSSSKRDVFRGEGGEPEKVNYVMSMIVFLLQQKMTWNTLPWSVFSIATLVLFCKTELWMWRWRIGPIGRWKITIHFTENVQLSNEKTLSCLGYIGDYPTQFNMVFTINHYKDPYSTTSIVESKRVFFMGFNTTCFGLKWICWICFYALVWKFRSVQLCWEKVDNLNGFIFFEFFNGKVDKLEQFQCLECLFALS